MIFLINFIGRVNLCHKLISKGVEVERQDVKVISNNFLIDKALLLFQSGKRVCIRVKGNSMFPFLYDRRDLVILEHFVFKRLKVGDILLYRYKGSYLLHRFIFVRNNMLYLRGDANNTNHYEVIKIEDVLGLVIGVNRNGHEINCDSWQWRFLSLLWVKNHKCRVCLYTCYCYLRKVRK